MNKKYLCIKDNLLFETKGSTPKYVNKSLTIVLNQKCVRNGMVDYSFSQYISEQQNIADGKYVKIGDVLLNSTGQGTAGRCAFVDHIPENYKVTVDSHMLILRFENIELARFFAYSLYKQESYILELLTGSSGQGELDREIVYNISFPFDDKNLKIFNKILVAINNKIKLNNKINKELENLAKTLYEYWFVQFDFPDENKRPYKSSGGAMVYNDVLKREIPVCWEVKNLFDAMDVQYGYPFNTDMFFEESYKDLIPVVRIRDILDNTVSAYSSEIVNDKYKLFEKDLVIGMDGNFHMNFWKDNCSYLNQRSVRIRKKEPYNISTFQAYYELMPYIKAREKNISRTTVGHLSDKDLKRLNIIIPKTNNNFNPTFVFENLLQKIIVNRKEIADLVTLRDFLLPMLMNGQIAIIAE